MSFLPNAAFASIAEDAAIDAPSTEKLSSDNFLFVLSQLHARSAGAAA